MYFPFLRGKQYELILLRENADLLAANNITPIIEPVRSGLSPLRRSLSEIFSAGASAIVIANPSVGDFSSNTAPLLDFLREQESDWDRLVTAVGIGPTTNTDTLSIAQEFTRPAAFHVRQVEDKALIGQLSRDINIHYHIFDDEQCGKLYRAKFNNAVGTAVLLRDGFAQRRNADYAEHEHFSDLHATYSQEGVDGFGDYLIVGSQYQEGGGPAYAVVIHLTYVDDDDDMQICHFKSSRNDSPADPGGKFHEALAELIRALDGKIYPIETTAAVEEFRDLHMRGHYPGLGYVKKLCMQHHIETMARFLSR